MKILVTGASRGIGRAICIEALKRGHEVHAVVRKPQDCPVGCQAHVADVRDRQVMSAIIQRLAPQLDWFIINAGIGESLSPRKIESAEKAAEIIEVNTTAAIYSAYAIAHEWIKLDQKGKRIALISSSGAGRGLPKSSVYIASKTALVSFAQGFERDLEKYGIGLSVVLPGFIDTDMTKELKSKPFLMQVDDAARIIFDGLERERFWIAFPKPLVLISRIRDSIPYFLFRWVVSQLQKRKVF